LTCLLKTGIEEPEEMTIAREWLCKHISTATNSHDCSNRHTPDNKELLEAVLSTDPSGDYIRRPARQAKESVGSPRD
jgi:hypothetical protein